MPELETVGFDAPPEFITSEDAQKAYTYLPEDIEIPKLYEDEDTPLDEKVLLIKLFLPDTRWSWFVTEADRDNGLCFGYVKSGIDPNFDEWGYFSLKELKELRSPVTGLPVERDIWWKPLKFEEAPYED